MASTARRVKAQPHVLTQERRSSRGQQAFCGGCYLSRATREPRKEKWENSGERQLLQRRLGVKAFSKKIDLFERENACRGRGRGRGNERISSRFPR